jgi:hypothetical protein
MAYWRPICGILEANLRHIGSLFAAYCRLVDYLRHPQRWSLWMSDAANDIQKHHLRHRQPRHRPSRPSVSDSRIGLFQLLKSMILFLQNKAYESDI